MEMKSRKDMEREYPETRVRRLSAHSEGLYLAHSILFDISMMSEPQIRSTRAECRLSLDKALKTVDGPCVNLFADLVKYCDLVLKDLESEQE